MRILDASAARCYACAMTTATTSTTPVPAAPVTLDEIRAALGAEGVRAAILRALAEHATVTEAARSLGTPASCLRRAAVRVGIEWQERDGAPGSAGGHWSREARAERAARAKKKRTKTPRK